VFVSWFSRDEVPILRSQRLLLREPLGKDYKSWADLRRRSRDFLKPFEPRWTEQDLTPQAYTSRLRRSRQEARQGSEYSFFIFLRQDQRELLVGGLTLSNIRRRAAQFVTLGYWMGADEAGKGIMTEAVSMVLPFVFDTLGLHRIHAACLPNNLASRRVLEKNGFADEGYAKHYLQIDGVWADHVLFGLTREQYDAFSGRSRR